LTLKVCIANSL